MPVPWAKLVNPQTLNLYQYVGNNPLTGVDPDGHMCVMGEAVANYERRSKNRPQCAA